MSQEPLLHWKDGAPKKAILDFVEKTIKKDSPSFVPVGDRIAVFDNDGTLWCEKPMIIELGFILQRLVAMAEKDPALRERQPWQAAYEKNYAWLGGAITKHYQGDDNDVRVMIGGIMEAFSGMRVDEYATAAGAFLQAARHPTLGVAFKDCTYVPMVELLQYLEMNGFSTFIASGGSRDFMRTVTEEIYGISSDRVIGSCSALHYSETADGGDLVYGAQLDVFDDGPAKPVRIWSRVGRRPILAAGNSDGDIPMLQFAGAARPTLRLLILHDDKDREFEYVAGAERSLKLAAEQGWTVVSIKNDWSAVFGTSATRSAAA
jgi:phosphoserine phosphatase